MRQKYPMPPNTLLCLCILVQIPYRSTQIIGSSVVTSVSVVLGNEDMTTASSVSPPKVSASLNPQVPPGKVVMVLKNATTDPGVLSVIATLKNIVKEQSQKHKNGTVTPTPTPPPSITTPMDDDDEAEEASDRPPINIATKEAPTEFPISMVVKTFEPEPEIDPENEAPASAEVQAAIHRISGALLKPAKKKTKPAQNILSDFLGSFNDDLNSSLPHKVTSTNFQVTRKINATTTAPLSHSKKNGSISHIKEGAVGNGSKLTSTKGTSKLTESTTENETKEIVSPIAEVTSKPTRKPAKQKPFIYFTKSGVKNISAAQKRPADFYDDEIFGYDPYQTFLHGIYFAQNDEEVGLTTTVPSDVPHHYHVVNMQKLNTAMPMVQKVKTENSGSKKGKPVPSLPDYLHRPRPSHLQYQHTAADTIDTETGLTTVKVPHPGENFANMKQNLEPDKLSLLSPRPILPGTIVGSLSTQLQSKLTPPIIPAPPPSSTAPPTIKNSAKIQTKSPFPAKIEYSEPHESQHSIHSDEQELKSGIREQLPVFPKAPYGNPGLEGTITNLDKEMKSFVDISNRLALRFFAGVTNPESMGTESKNVVFSPFTVTSSLGMLFLGARGSTATQLDNLLKLDDQLAFNPHLLYHNISQSFLSQSNTAAAIIRLLIADKNKGDVLDFYKMRVQHFYEARVEEADFKYAGHLAQSIINQMIRAQIQRSAYEMLNSSLSLTGPLTLLTATFFDAKFGGAQDHSVKEMDFVHLADLGRQIIPIEAVGLRGPFRGAYDEFLDATAVEVPFTSRDLSLLFILPGEAGEYPIGGMESLKRRLTLESWTRLMRSFTSRSSFKIIFPRFRHHSALNLTHVVRRFGLTDMFYPHLAKFTGINGLKDLFLDPNLLHWAELSTYEKLSDTFSEAAANGKEELDFMKILKPNVRGEPLSLTDWIFKSRTPANVSLPPKSYTRIRSSRDSVVAEPIQKPEKVIRFERPFLYALRHNPSGTILMMGQYMEPTN